MKPYVISGLVGGLLGISFKLFLFLTERFNVQSLIFSNVMELGIVALVPVFSSIYQYKYDSRLGFEKRFKPILGASLITTLSFAGFAYVYFAYINPDFAGHFVMENEAIIRQNSPKPEDFKKMVDFYLNHFQPLNQATSAAFGMFFVGLLFSLLSAAISGFFKGTAIKKIV